MKQTTDSRLQKAKEVTKEQLVNKIKTSDPTRFDQMLIETEERKSYFFVKYNSLAYTRNPKILRFPLFKDLVNDFEKSIENSGEIKILEDDRIISNVIAKGKDPIDSPKHSGKNLIFSELKLVTENDKVKLKQPIYYIPSETERCTCNTCKGDMYNTCTESECRGQHIYDCSKCRTAGTLDCVDCKARGEYTCHSCNGGGRLICSDCGGSGKDRSSNLSYVKCKRCNGSGDRKCSSLSGHGLVGAVVKKAAGNEYCGGSGIIRCSECKATGKITCDKCEGDGKIECKTCHSDHIDNRYGKVDCMTCETAGELASISYIETEIKADNLDLIFSDGIKIEAPNFGVDSIKKHVNSNGQLSLTYKNLNGDNQDVYDEHSTFCSKSALAQIGASKEKYPKLIIEEMYYEGVPCATFNYNHILSASFHDVSVLSIDQEQDVLFHSNPTAVADEKESLKEKVSELCRRAFSTKSFKDKIDRKHEMFLMVHMAKADGIIEEQEKKYLAKTITGLHGFTNKEKGELFGLMSSNTLPPISPLTAYFSSKDRATEAINKIIELVAKADHEYAPEEKAKLEEINNAIEAGYKVKPSAIGQFIKTWQVSLSVLIMMLSAIAGLFYITYLKPRQDALETHIMNVNNETLLKEYVLWTGIDTINNLDFSTFAADFKNKQSSEESDDSDFDESMVNPLGLFDKILHESDLLLDGSKLSYKDYWIQHKTSLKVSLDSLTPIINRRILARNNVPKDDDVSTEETVVDDKFYTISDPDGYSNLRMSPDGEIIQQINEGEVFKIIGKEGKYNKVRLEDGTEGYIFSSRIVLFESYEGISDEPTGEYTEEESEELDPEYE